MYQRGKNVVSASSGKATRSQPRAFASPSSSSSRFTTAARGSSRPTGPSWAAPTVTRRAIVLQSPSRTGRKRSGGLAPLSMAHGEHGQRRDLHERRGDQGGRDGRGLGDRAEGRAAGHLADAPRLLSDGV